MPDALLDAIGRGVRVFDLGREMFVGMPQSPNHPEFRLALQRRHGDIVRPGGGSAANELIVTGGHVGTHIDALSHVSQDGVLHGGISASEAQTGGRFNALGIETVAPLLCRGVLLDVAAALGVEECDAAYEVTVADLQAASERQGTPLRRGDVALIRTGWGRRWPDKESYVAIGSGVPGPGEDAAKWLAAAGIVAAGADTIAFEQIAPAVGHSVLPVHRVLLVEHGVHIIETLALEELAQARVYEFTFVLSPLKLVGGTGSPARPLAIVSGS